MAARGINKVILIGNLGDDPEVRYSATGSAVSNIRLATTDTWRDKETGENQERTEWHRVVFFNRLAEIVGEFLRKGSQVYIEGRIQTRKWQDREGADRYTTEIIANEMQMLGGGRRSESGDFNAPQTKNWSEKTTPTKKGKTPDPPKDDVQPVDKVDEFDDDIPF